MADQFILMKFIYYQQWLDHVCIVVQLKIHDQINDDYVNFIKFLPLLAESKFKFKFKFEFKRIKSLIQTTKA